MVFKEVLLLFTLTSICLALPVWENEVPMRKRDVGACADDVIKRMATFGVDASKLECYSRTRVRRSCCVAECIWMAMELGVEPSSLICPT